MKKTFKILSISIIISITLYAIFLLLNCNKTSIYLSHICSSYSATNLSSFYAEKEKALCNINNFSLNNDSSPDKDSEQESVPLSTLSETPYDHSFNIPSDDMTYTNNNSITFYKDGFSYEDISSELQDYIYGKSYKEDCSIPYSSLRLVKVLYYDFSDQAQQGELICNASIAKDLVEIFYELYCSHYQIEEISLIDQYNADDELSMEHNNSSCFNFRKIAGRKTLSKHAQGLAIDINPFYNPYVVHNSDGTTSITPIGSEIFADRTNSFEHKITTDDLCYQLFLSHGFQWGGNWKNVKDYQHFEK